MQWYFARWPHDCTWGLDPPPQSAQVRGYTFGWTRCPGLPKVNLQCVHQSRRQWCSRMLSVYDRCHLRLCLPWHPNGPLLARAMGEKHPYMSPTCRVYLNGLTLTLLLRLGSGASGFTDPGALPPVDAGTPRRSPVAVGSDTDYGPSPSVTGSDNGVDRTFTAHSSWTLRGPSPVPYMRGPLPAPGKTASQGWSHTD